jgi:hypothetical protein
MKKLIAFSLLVLSPLIYAQTGQHEHRMSPQVHRCMKVMDDPKYMEEMLEYMFQRKEEMKRILENNPKIRKHMEELLK